MTDLRKAAEMALEALNQATGMCAKRTSTRRDIDEAIQALRQALAQPEQEPVCTKIEGNQFDTFKVRYEDAVKLKDLPVGTKLYTAPPKREWVGLTDKEIQQVVYDLGTIGDLSHDEFDIARAVAQALKERNT